MSEATILLIEDELGVSVDKEGVGPISFKTGFRRAISTCGGTIPLPSVEVGELASREGGTTVKPAKHDFPLILTPMGV